MEKLHRLAAQLARSMLLQTFTLLVGTDCSGLDTPIVSLKNHLGIRLEHQWSCDSAKHVEMFIRCNHCPKKFFKNMFHRRVRLLPDIHLYVAGFPCQVWSLAGRRQGRQVCKKSTSSWARHLYVLKSMHAAIHMYEICTYKHI